MISQAESDSQDRGLSAPQAKEIDFPLTQVDPRKHLLTRQGHYRDYIICFGSECSGMVTVTFYLALMRVFRSVNLYFANRGSAVKRHVD